MKHACCLGRALAISVFVFVVVSIGACDSNRPASAGPSNVTSGMVPVDGGSLYYETLGKGAPVILIHGGFGDRRMWDPQFETLSQAFRVVRYDHRGFGKSSAPAQAYSPVADLVKLMDHLELKRANLVGNSMGGTLALDFALLQPDRTGAVVVIASAAGGYPTPEEDLKNIDQVLRTARDKGTGAAVPLWLQHPMVSVAMSHATAGPLVRTMVEDNQKMFVADHWPQEQMSPPAFERMAGLNANVLFIVGDRDIASVRAGAEASAARIKKSKIVTIKDADHLPHMEKPAEVNKLLVEYISLNGC
jgi:pimeloyl-ACP methyl ester carboxylesterase